MTVGTMRGLRNAFLTGVFLCLPLALTIYVVQLLVDLAAKPAKGLVEKACAWVLNTQDAATLAQNAWAKHLVVPLSALIVVLGVTVVGVLSRHFFGRFVINGLEGIIGRVPMIKSVYASIKQMVETFSAKNKATFKQVVLVQFPHLEAWTVAFVTNRDASELSEKLGYPVVHVFVPTTPNPTGGYFLVLRESAAIPLRMSVSEGMRLIVSGGAMLPAMASTPPLSEGQKETQG